MGSTAALVPRWLTSPYRRKDTDTIAFLYNGIGGAFATIDKNQFDLIGRQVKMIGQLTGRHPGGQRVMVGSGWSVFRQGCE